MSTLNLSANERANDPELDRNRLLKPVEVQAYNILWMRGTQCFMSVPASLISKTVSGSRESRKCNAINEMGINSFAPRNFAEKATANQKSVYRSYNGLLM